MTAELSFLTLNIGNPSEQRARRQLSWLAARQEHVLVLTETKASAGCRLLVDGLTEAGWQVSYPVPEPGGYGVMIATTVRAEPGPFGDQVGYLPARAASVILPLPSGPLEVIGAYVPSRDAGAEKTERKRTWLARCHAALTDRHPRYSAVFLGDLNILEPDHRPRYPFFAPFEYDFYRALVTDLNMTDVFRLRHRDAIEHSWVGRTGDGYRYDHVFCSAEVEHLVSGCEYLHQCRFDKLTDHSALTAQLEIEPPELLPRTPPIAATLF
jgi:exodeoxyribonuclease-3